MIGLTRLTRRATRENRRGLPNDSRYSRIVFVRSSCSEVLQQVVAGHVGFVADADEMRQTQLQLLSQRQDRDPQRAALRHHRDAARRRVPRGKGGVELHGWIGVDQPEAIRTDQAHAVASGLLHDAPLELPPVLAGFAKTRGNHHQRLDAPSGALIDHAEHRIPRHHEDRQIHRLGQLANAGVGLDRAHRRGVRVDGIHRPLEMAQEQRLKEAVADGRGLARGADDRHALRLKERPQRHGGEQAVPRFRTARRWLRWA